MKKINIIQFSPYFPPHKGGLETVAEEISKYWTEEDYGKFINITTDFNQNELIEDNSVEKIIFDNENIGYKKNNYIVLVVPSREIVFNFPIFNFKSKKYKIILKYIEKEIINSTIKFQVITHTRFFTQSLYGGLFAKKYKLKWNHIEHGSGYAKLSSKFKTFIGIIYDNLIGKYIFKNANNILPISKACESFVYNIGGKKNSKKTNIFYRGLNLSYIDTKKTGDIKLVFVGRLVGLKGVNYLINVYKKLNIKNQLIIIGDGDEKKSLIKNAKGFNINFLGFKNRDFVIDYLSTNNCIFINPSYQEGLPTTVIEALATGNVTIATDVGGTKEISDNDDLLKYNAGDIERLKVLILESINKFDSLKGLSLKHIENKFCRKKNILNLYELIK